MRGPGSAPQRPKGEPLQQQSHRRGDDDGPQKRHGKRRARLAHDEQADERPEHEDLPVGHVDDVEHSEDERVSQRHDGVDAAQRDAVDQLLEEHARLRRFARISGRS